MIGDPHKRHYAEHKAQCDDMNRNDEHQQRDHDSAGQGLPRMKRHCRPRSWRPTFMVDGMRKLEPIGPVHQAVRPVKPGVMGKHI